MPKTGMDADDFRTVKARKPRVVDVAQQSIFSLPQPPSVPVSTSEDAADFQHQTGRDADLRVLVLRYIHAAKQGCTDAELEDLTGLPGNTERARRWDLLQQGLIRRDESVRRTYRDKAGMSHRPAFPWVATVKGDDCLRGLTPWPWAAKRK